MILNQLGILTYQPRDCNTYDGHCIIMQLSFQAWIFCGQFPVPRQEKELALGDPALGGFQGNGSLTPPSCPQEKKLSTTPSDSAEE